MIIQCLSKYVQRQELCYPQGSHSCLAVLLESLCLSKGLEGPSTRCSECHLQGREQDSGRVMQLPFDLMWGALDGMLNL